MTNQPLYPLITIDREPYRLTAVAPIHTSDQIERATMIPLDKLHEHFMGRLVLASFSGGHIVVTDNSDQGHRPSVEVSRSRKGTPLMSGGVLCLPQTPIRPIKTKRTKNGRAVDLSAIKTDNSETNTYTVWVLESSDYRAYGSAKTPREAKRLGRQIAYKLSQQTSEISAKRDDRNNHTCKAQRYYFFREVIQPQLSAVQRQVSMLQAPTSEVTRDRDQSLMRAVIVRKDRTTKQVGIQSVATNRRSPGQMIRSKIS